MIEFRSRITAPLIMLDDAAFEILTIIGKGHSRQGILTIAQLPEAIRALTAASTADKAEQPAASAWPEDDNNDFGAERAKSSEPIYLSQRAWPFLQMLKDALEYNEDVVWGV